MIKLSKCIKILPQISSRLLVNHTQNGDETHKDTPTMPHTLYNKFIIRMEKILHCKKNLSINKYKYLHFKLVSRRLVKLPPNTFTHTKTE